jgi:WhiB family transcriptional regulator, redox-sensing transcriptional regulator
MGKHARPEAIDRDGLLDEADWRDAGACLHADADLFFPIGTIGRAVEQVEQAKRICRDCPVQQLCLAWALDLGAVSGIWGGTTNEERRATRAAARRRHPAHRAAQTWQQAAQA